MISEKTLKSLEYDKILSSLSEYAVLKRTKSEILSFSPCKGFSETLFLLNKTKEAYKLLYTYSTPNIWFFEEIEDFLKRVDKGGTLFNAELLEIANNLKSARIIKTAFSSVKDDTIKILKELSDNLFINQDFEKEISEKIISEDQISDNASPKLYSIRKRIRELNVKIRERLNSYMKGSDSKYLQDGVVTIRRDRYVIPVKSEYRSFIKGFIHDQSSTGSTVFIEPEAVLELNNELNGTYLEESNEMQRILAELSYKVSFMSDALRVNSDILSEIDFCYARAIYAFKNKCSEPILNDKGIIDIKRGRHPLIPKDSVVPVSVSLGEKYNFILITGPNTGGKTVTLKLVGLLTVMAMSGMFIPADDESKISFFEGVYSDIGDEQSIEQSLSTFSSHVKNIINIINNVTPNSLILLDEIGAGTDPDEGSALALSIIKKLLDCNCFGIITTHYSKLKEFAVNCGKIENASMEFDAKNLKPVYKLNIGIPGSSNAIDIAKTLGLDESIILDAYNNLSDKSVSFEGVLKKAEESRRESEKLKTELEILKDEKESELKEISAEKEKIIKEREKIYNTAKQETKRIVSEKLSEAEEIIDELKSILKTANLESKEAIRASELKNKLKNSRYLFIENENQPIELIPAKDSLKTGGKVYIKSLDTYGKVLSVKKEKGEATVSIGNLSSTVKIKDLYNFEGIKEDNNVKIYKQNVNNLPVKEINVIGKTLLDALDEVESFIYQAIMNNLTEVKIIHGVGEGILLKSIRETLKNDKRIKSIRRGKYGEGENGVTIVTLK